MADEDWPVDEEETRKSCVHLWDGLDDEERRAMGIDAMLLAVLHRDYNRDIGVRRRAQIERMSLETLNRMARIYVESVDRWARSLGEAGR